MNDSNTNDNNCNNKKSFRLLKQKAFEKLLVPTGF